MYCGLFRIDQRILLNIFNSSVSFSDTNVSAAFLSEMATQQVADQVVVKQ